MHGKSASEHNFSGVGCNFRVFQGIFPGANKIPGFSWSSGDFQGLLATLKIPSVCDGWPPLKIFIRLFIHSFIRLFIHSFIRLFEIFINYAIYLKPSSNTRLFIQLCERFLLSGVERWRAGLRTLSTLNSIFR